MQLLVIALLGLGVVMVHSAGMSVGGSPFSAGRLLSSRNVIYAALAVAALVFASRLDVRAIFRGRGIANPLLYMLTSSIVLVGLTFVPGIGKTVNGSSRWLYLGPPDAGLSFQPSELVKWTMVVAIAFWCARRQGVMRSFRHGLLPPLALTALACGMIVIEDLGTAALIGLIAVLMLYAGGARWWHLGLLAPAAFGAFTMAVMHSAYRRERLLAFLDPWADPQGTGYHAIQSMLAVAMGGVTGRGLGNGIQKFGYLPEDTTDFVFAIICEEMGLAGAVLVVALFLALLWWGLTIARDCRDIFGRLLALGVLMTVGFQTLINLLVVTVLVPTKGIALPLISAGGTGWIFTAFALGAVAALDEANHLDDLEVGPGGEPTLHSP